MRKARILYKGKDAGMLIQLDDGTFTFRYNDLWMADTEKPSISLTLPKTMQEFYSAHLFPFFYNMIPEGTNKEVACKLMRIDENDYFGLLLATAKFDTIGAVTLKKPQEFE